MEYAEVCLFLVPEERHTLECLSLNFLKRGTGTGHGWWCHRDSVLWAQIKNHESFSTHFFTLGNTPTLFPGFEVSQMLPGALGLVLMGLSWTPQVVPVPGGQPDEWLPPNVSTAFLFAGSREIGLPQRHLQAADAGWHYHQIQDQFRTGLPRIHCRILGLNYASRFVSELSLKSVLTTVPPLV